MVAAQKIYTMLQSSHKVGGSQLRNLDRKKSYIVPLQLNCEKSAYFIEQYIGSQTHQAMENLKGR